MRTITTISTITAALLAAAIPARGRHARHGPGQHAPGRRLSLGRDMTAEVTIENFRRGVEEGSIPPRVDLPEATERLFAEKAARRGVPANKVQLLYRYLVALDHGTEDRIDDPEFAEAAWSLAEASAIIVQRLASLG